MVKIESQLNIVEEHQPIMHYLSLKVFSNIINDGIFVE